MIKNYIAIGLMALASTASSQTTHELTNIGNTFSPTVINIVAGDSIHLVLIGPHTCTQVDQATWEANENLPNGGFDYPAGEFTFAVNEIGTVYYVCSNHVANMGMKGKFIVEDGAGVKEVTDPGKFRLFPNPALTQVRIDGFELGQSVQVLDGALKLVLETTPKADGVLDISALKAGSYNVYVSDSRGQRSTILPLLIIR